MKLKWESEDTQWGRRYHAETPTGSYSIFQHDTVGSYSGGWRIDYTAHMGWTQKEGHGGWGANIQWQIPPESKWRTIEGMGEEDYYENPFQHYSGDFMQYSEGGFGEEFIGVRLPFVSQQDLENYILESTQLAMELVTKDMRTGYVEEVRPTGEHIKWPAKPFRRNHPFNGFSAVKYAKQFAELLQPYHEMLSLRAEQLIESSINNQYIFQRYLLWNEEEEEEEEGSDMEEWDY